MKERKKEKVEKITFDDNRLANHLFGVQGEHVKRIQRALGVKITTKANTVIIYGDDIEVDLSRKLIQELYSLLGKGYPLYPSDIDYSIQILSADNSANLEEIFLDTIYISSKKGVITPKSLVQKEY
ncbi:MAG: phosphate starvation-inducible protein PhoH, partial [Thermodesulfobacteriota bacterium]